MAPPVEPADRYEPLPGLLGLPSHFLRKLSPRGRRLVAVAGIVLLAAAVATAIVLAPRISESKRERAAAERRAHARAVAEERARLEAEQRPRFGRAAGRGGAGTLISSVESAITRDARSRAASGEFKTAAQGADCRTLGRDRGRLILACTAVTSQQGKSEATAGLVVGYPYRAAVSPRTGRYAFCKTSGRPAEGLLTREGQVPLPRVCGG
jgi:hypothetical protein